jgi:hypothetical protein
MSIITMEVVKIGSEKMQRENGRYLVTIRCKACGERFTFKGRMRKGKVETGFKKCICDNETDFDIQNEKIK